MTDSSVIVTILPWFLAVGSVIVAYFEHKERIKIETKPNIAVFSTLGSQDISKIELHIKNYGPGIARNVTFSILEGGNFCTPSGEGIKDLDIIQNGIDPLGRDEERSFVLTKLSENYVEKKMDVNITISVIYENESGDKFTPKPFNIRFKEFHGLRYAKHSSATPVDFTAGGADEHGQCRGHRHCGVI